jgi:serine/threonine protein kinase
MELARQRIETLFDAALELKSPAERGVYLERECAGDVSLRARLERLLSAHERSQSFFENCRPGLSAPEDWNIGSSTQTAEEETGQRIGPYKLLQKIGEGGCGVVYMAEQDKPVRRRVALKIIKLGMDTKNVIARFEAERQALAMMDHPNIARVFDAGATETGRPYFVMELVHGIRITDYCDQRKLTPPQRLELFIQVCHAIQHAHQKGIIHRDIKPSNILVTHHDGEPVPKVIDFGIAKAIEEKLTDKTLFTIYGHFIGTPAYMSPEQAEMSGLDVDTRSDIYSLGVLLYELLTGKTPFDQTELLASGLDEMRRTLREREPHRPSTKLDTLQTEELTATAQHRLVEAPKLQLLLKGDLDWIVMKALEKDRRRRYDTANGLAMDIRRYLEHEPIFARPPSRWYRFEKLVRRNRGTFAAAAAVALALIIGLGTATWLFVQERELRKRAVAAEEVAEHARASETELRRQAETREKITYATYLISQGKLDEADKLVAETAFEKPTLEGAAVLRALGEWHAQNSRWQQAATRLVQLSEINRLDSWEVSSADFLRTSAALGAAGDQAGFEEFRRTVLSRFAGEKNAIVAQRIAKACLLLPPAQETGAAMDSLAHAFASTAIASIGNPRAASEGLEEYSGRLKLQNVGARRQCSIESTNGLVIIVAGGANIWETNDEFAYARTVIAGDFDFRMRVHEVAPRLDDFTRVGLMARESGDGGSSRHVMVAVNANNTFQVVMRSAEGALSDSVPHNPLPTAFGSNSWVRLQRVGAIFHAYTSSNGVDWAQLYQTTGGDKPFSDPIYFGIAAGAHSTNAVSTNILSDLSATPAVSPEGALTLALLEIRHGKAGEAAEWCRRVLAYPECNEAEYSTAHVILAMACHGMGQTDESQRQLSLARDVIGKRLATSLETGGKSEGFWFDWVFAQVLMKKEL